MKASTPHLLNTYFYIKDEDAESVSVADYFANSSKLGDYSVIQLSLNKRRKIKVVVDQNSLGLEKTLKKFFKKDSIQKLNVRQVKEFLHYFQNKRSLNLDLGALIGLAPQRSISRTKFLDIFYLDDIQHLQSQRPLILALIAQILIEKYTNRDSRISYIRTKNSFKKGYYAVALRSRKNPDEAELLNPLAPFRNPVFIGSDMSSNTLSPEEQNFAPQIVRDHLEVLPISKQKKSAAQPKQFSIYASNGKELNFNILGRTPASKRFIKEQEQYANAKSPNEMIPIEVCFHPFWRRLGHTTLRVGTSLFELTKDGWRGHIGKEDSARAFVFNNPFMKQKYKKYSRFGMSPASIGATFMVEQYRVQEMLSHLNQLSNATGKEQEKFSLNFNNCNQGIMRVLKRAGIPGFTDKGFQGFSTMLSFRKLLINPDIKVTGLYVYLLPGVEVPAENLRRIIPNGLYKHNTMSLEFYRAFCTHYVDLVRLDVFHHIGAFFRRIISRFDIEQKQLQEL